MFKDNKKAVELPLNVMVISALVLIILIVLIVIFINGAGSWKTAVSCENNKGECHSTCPAGYSSSAYKCPDKESKCCLPIISNGK